jgi:hypothetical protein
MDINVLERNLERNGWIKKIHRQSLNETGKQKDWPECSQLNTQPGLGASTHRSDASTEYTCRRYDTSPPNQHS